MIQLFALIFGLALMGGIVYAQDPVKTDGDKYHVILENTEVRVLDYQDKPGTKTSQHHHPKSVLYALSTFKRKLTFPDGKTSIREFKPGDILWLDEQTHVGENIGTTDTHVLLVEIKTPVAESAKDIK
jgi:beta-alanine degradation protein BauB